MSLNIALSVDKSLENITKRQEQSPHQKTKQMKSRTKIPPPYYPSELHLIIYNLKIKIWQNFVCFLKEIKAHNGKNL